MDGLFDDPGDLGFFYEEDAEEVSTEEQDEFYEPMPGEDN